MTEETKDYAFETIYTLKQPLSHIGESESTTSFLNTTTVINDGKPEEVFTYTGNAIRGQLRDCGARYFLDKLGLKVPLNAFYLLFSGGSIGGAQSIDIDQARKIRAALPLVSIFGGGVGNQILDGKLKQTFAYPICKETNAILPDYLQKSETSWRAMTNEIQFSRKDDEKNVILSGKFLLGEGVTDLLEGETKKKKEPATQMRYAVEYLAPGTQLYHQWRISCTELELGAFVSALHEWQKAPYLGGMAGKGFGMVSADIDMATGKGLETFMTVGNGYIQLSETAQRAKDTYDQHIKSLYDTYLEEPENKEKFVALLGGETK